MTRAAWALRRFLRDKIVDRLTAEKVVDKRTIDNLANRLQAESLRSGEWAAEMLARVERLTAELAAIDKAYDEIGDRLAWARVISAERDAWIRRAVETMQWLAVNRPATTIELTDLLDTAPPAGEPISDMTMLLMVTERYGKAASAVVHDAIVKQPPVKPVSEKYR